MNRLIEQVNELRTHGIRKEIDSRVKKFKIMNKKGNKEWFSELCFCLLTANTSAEMGIRVQKQLGNGGFVCSSEKEMVERLKKAKSRFYNRRGNFIFEANKHKKIKTILKKQEDKREWLVKNIKGLSYKEASHFLRNVGFFDYAIIDKHILRLLHENKMISSVPECMNKNCYLNYENKLQKLADKLNLTQGELDLYLWYMKTGKVLK
jgi:N-glycosylase/DNA lyase